MSNARSHLFNTIASMNTMPGLAQVADLARLQLRP
jgi:hypothetical protein